MLKNLLNRIYRKEKGITGLETAIILIAFVVVAAVFAYTVLSAGLFSTQKSQEAVYAGLESAQSSLEMKGAMIGKAESGHTGASGTMCQVTFTLANALGGEPIDFTEPTAGAATGLAASASNNKVVISYIDQDQRKEDLYWTFDAIGENDGDDLLEANEKFQVTIGAAAHGAGAGNLIDALTTDLTVNKQFTLEIKTPNGAVMTLQRTTPAYFDSVMNLN